MKMQFIFIRGRKLQNNEKIQGSDFPHYINYYFLKEITDQIGVIHYYKIFYTKILVLKSGKSQVK